MQVVWSISIRNSKGKRFPQLEFGSLNGCQQCKQIQMLQTNHQDLYLLTGNILTITNKSGATSIDLSAYLDNTNLSETEVNVFIETRAKVLANTVPKLVLQYFLGYNEDLLMNFRKKLIGMPTATASGAMNYWNGDSRFGLR